MPQAVVVTKLGNCDLCGHRAAYNSPVKLPDGEIICDRCADEWPFNHDEPEFLYAIDQWLYDGKTRAHPNFDVIRHRMLTAHTDPERLHLQMVWWKDGPGGHAFPLTEAERAGPIEPTLRTIADFIASGYCRCTSCRENLEIEDVAGFPLFAGVACTSCWAKHQAATQEQRRTGRVCRMCNQPYNLCCC